jgi:hypothetical protein
LKNAGKPLLDAGRKLSVPHISFEFAQRHEHFGRLAKSKKSLLIPRRAEARYFLIRSVR